MAFDVSALTNYVDETKFGLLTQLQSTAGLADFVRMVPGIKGSANVHFLNTSVTFAADGCNYTPADATALTERNLAVGAIAIMEDICLKVLNQTWLETQLRAGAAGEEAIPQMVATAWTSDKMNKLARQIAISDFQGDTTSVTNNLSYYDGFIKIADADADVVDGNTGAVTSVTAANIIEVLQAMYLARPEVLREKSDVVLTLSQEWYDLYVVALINANLYHYKGDDSVVKLFGTDISLKPTVGLNGTNRMFMFSSENVIIGLDAEGESDKLDVWYSKDDRINKSLITFKRGVTIGFGNEIVEFTLA